ncbi:MAG TPA: isoaspartyl peptidase/L-asparaginase [Steroidobacteraceae bacterium]|nr:isoaspartyl peptidase/L-asparaginase [Steroidobacteraceae bacterium]
MGAAIGALGAQRAGLGADAKIEVKQRMRVGSKPALIAAGNSFPYLNAGYEILRSNGDTLDAAIAVVRGPEDDPTDDSVGLGGLPNEEGTVELDASCMHGPTRRAGAVGAVHNIKNVSMLAREVMLHSGHVMLVGEGAERFAVARGFQRENLLTDASRKVWLLWKEAHSDWWGPGLDSPQWREHLREQLHSDVAGAYFDRLRSIADNLGIAADRQRTAIRDVLFPSTGTTHCSALSPEGAMSGCTTTSGLAWKIPGRLGDSPVIGAGCYTDQAVGSAGATGSGEENIKIAGTHTIIENMRKGMTPLDAGMDALQRIVRTYNGDRERLKFIDMTYYILRKDGAYAGVSLWTGYEPGRPHTIAVHDGAPRLEKTVNVFEGVSREWPPLMTPSTSTL